MRDYFDISGVLETTEFEIAQVACRPPSLSRNQGEWINYFEFSEVRDKQIDTKKPNSLTFSY